MKRHIQRWSDAKIFLDEILFFYNIRVQEKHAGDFQKGVNCRTLNLYLSQN